MKGILGRKVGMTQVFTTSGKLIPVTVVEVDSNVVTQIKTVEKDGYNSIQLGAFTKTKKASNKPETGHSKKANTEPKRFLKEIKTENVSNYEVGQVLDASIFEKGEIVDVTGTSKGKGFQGVIKRWNQSRGPMTHGSHYHRGVGSLGTMLPMRVLKGKKLAGHMGHEQVTIQNLEIIDVDLENNCILVSGNIPGPKNSYVLIREAIKNNGKAKNAEELVSYIVEEVETETVKEEATIEENSVEESKENTNVVKEDVKEEIETIEETNKEVEKIEETVEKNEGEE